MLLSIVNPSAEIREGYQYYLVATTDDRVLSGFFVDRDNQITVLRNLEAKHSPSARRRSGRPSPRARA